MQRTAAPGELRSRVLADGWYSWLAAEELTPLSAQIARWPAPVQSAILRSGALRGVVLALLSSRFGAVAAIRQDPGWRTLLLLRAVAGRRRKIVALHFIDHAPGEDRIDRLWQRVEVWAIRRTVSVAQVLSAEELAAYPARFGLPAARFRLIQFAWRTAPAGTPAPVARAGGVLAAGRAYCDWETLLTAAAGRDWPLTVVCDSAQLPEVKRLEARLRSGATVLCDLPHQQVHELLRSAAVSVICLHPGLPSRGHVRLCDAVDAGAAVVASDVDSLAGYVEDGVTGLLVTPGDPVALRDGVERVLNDADLRGRLVRNAFARAESWTGPEYLAAIVALCTEQARVGSVP